MEDKIDIYFEKQTGYGVVNKNIKYTSIWATDMDAKGTLYFYGNINNKGEKDPKHLVDIRFKPDSTNEIIVYLFPHNTDTVSFSVEDALQLRLLLLMLKERYPSKEVFTINYKTLQVVTSSDFNRYTTPTSINPDERTFDSFIFSTEDVLKGELPEVHIIELRPKNDEFTEIFPIQTWASRWAFPIGSKMTVDGKYVAFLTLRGYMSGKFNPIALNLANIKFPTKHNESIPAQFVTKELEEFLVKMGVNKIIRAADGKIINMQDEEEKVIDALPIVSSKDVEEKIVRDIVDKGALNLTDIVAYGAAEVLNLIPVDRVSNVNIDIALGATKMVIFGGYYYAIATPESREVLTSEFDELLIYVNSENELPK